MWLVNGGAGGVVMVVCVVVMVYMWSSVCKVVVVVCWLCCGVWVWGFWLVAVLVVLGGRGVDVVCWWSWCV